MNLKDWAENEVDIAINEIGKDEDCMNEYYIGCYKSALKAYKCLLDDGHSGMSISITKRILDSLIDGKPLTPITEDDFKECEPIDTEGSIQCKRMSSLFKRIDKDGKVTYNDVDRAVFIDTETGVWQSGLINRIINEMFPISFPYAGIEHYDVHGEEILTDLKNGDFDTIAINYIVIKPRGERIEVNRYFKSPENDNEVERYPNWVEIYKDEWVDRYNKAQERIANLDK